MADALPLALVALMLVVVLYGGVSAIDLLRRVLARAGAPWWVLPLLLLAVMAAVRGVAA